MEIIKVKDYEELSKKASKIICENISNNKSLVLGLPTGSTPVGLFQELIKATEEKRTTFKNVKAVVLDEYCDIKYNIEHSARYFLDYNLFNKVNIEKDNILSINIKNDDVEDECLQFNKILDENQIDIQVLGIGANGHIGFNEPGSSFTERTRISKLDFKTRLANQKFFNNLDEVPQYAITMGIADIMRAKKVILLVSGISKADAIKRLLTLEVNEEFPASVLINHPNVTVIIDEDACANLK